MALPPLHRESVREDGRAGGHPGRSDDHWAEDIRSAFDARDRVEVDQRLGLIVEKWRTDAPTLAKWMEQNIREGLTDLTRPAAHRKHLRAVNLAERLNKELHRRTRVATLFPNESALLRLASAVLIEISEERETSRRDLKMEPE